MAVREGFLEEVLSKLIVERISGKNRKVDGGDREFQAEGTARTKVVQGEVGKLGCSSGTSERRGVT